MLKILFWPVNFCKIKSFQPYIFVLLKGKFQTNQNSWPFIPPLAKTPLAKIAV